MENQTIEQRKEKIREKYNKTLNGLYNKSKVCYGLAVILALGGLGKAAYDNLTYKPHPRARQYQEMVSTLDTLKQERDSLKKLELSYQPEKIKPYLEQIIDKTAQSRRDALDSAIEIVETDIQEARNWPEVISNKKEQERLSSTIFAYPVLGGLIPLLPFFVIFTPLYAKTRKKKEQELKALETN